MSALKYVGGGAYLPDVPARDLTAEEAAQFADILAAAEAAGQGLYVAVEEAPVTVTEQEGGEDGIRTVSVK